MSIFYFIVIMSDKTDSGLFIRFGLLYSIPIIYILSLGIYEKKFVYLVIGFIINKIFFTIILVYIVTKLLFRFGNNISWGKTQKIKS